MTGLDQIFVTLKQWLLGLLANILPGGLLPEESGGVDWLMKGTWLSEC